MSFTSLRSVLMSVAASAVLCSTAHSAVVLGQLDNFEDNTTQGWFSGGGGGGGPPVTPPSNVSTGGPTGPGDAFLSVAATGGIGPGSRLAAMNTTRWSGDYIGAGVTRLQMDVNNFGPEDLHLRLLFEDFTVPGPPTSLAVTADGAHLPAGSGWQTISFDITPADLIALLGSVTTALMNTDTLRIFHNPAADFPGPPNGIPTVNAVLGVDNILAATGPFAVPEPGSLALLGAALFGLLGWRASRRASRESDQ
jgi:hypothetical protein